MAETPSDSSIAKSTLLMSVATLGSRFTGLARTWVMAFALGNTVITSAYQVANNMPNVIYELVAGGLLAAAFVPVYLLQKERLGDEAGNDFANTILNLAVVVLGVLSLLATVFAPQVIATQTFTVESTAEVTETAVLFFRIFAFQIVFYGIGGVITGILNANRVYFLPGVAPALNNVVVIISFLLYIPLYAIDARTALIVLAAGTTLGVAVQFVIQIPALLKTGYRWHPRINWHDPALIEALKITVPTFVYVIGTMVAFSCRNAFSLQSCETGPSTLIYAWTWFQLPYGVIAVSLSRTMFTEMADDAARGDRKQLRSHITSGIASTLILIIPLAVLMSVYSEPLMALFQAGKFSADDVAEVGRVLAVWSICLPFYSVVMFLYNVYASIRKFAQFAAVSCAMVIVQCILYAVLTPPEFAGLFGVPVADLVYYVVCCAVLLLLLRRHVGELSFGTIIGKAARALVASLVGGAVGYVLLILLGSLSGIVGGLVQLVVGGGIALAVSVAMLWVLRLPEADLVVGLVKKVLRRNTATSEDDGAMAAQPSHGKHARLEPSAQVRPHNSQPRHAKPCNTGETAPLKGDQ